MKIAINGFGRIGRQIFRLAFEKGIEINQINDPFLKMEQIRLLLMYDSVYGRFQHDVEVSGDTLLIDKKHEVLCTFEKDPCSLSLYEPDFLIDCSGNVCTNDAYKAILSRANNLKKIFVTTYTHSADQTIIMGVNEASFDTRSKDVVSTSTCDSVAILPLLNSMREKGIKSVSIITLHPYLSNQKLLDGCSMNIKDISLINEWRAAPESLIPKKTSVEWICTEMFPELKGRISGYQMRVPTSCVSCAFIDVNFTSQIDAQWTDSLISSLKKYYAVNNEYLISKDFMNNKDSGIIDLRRLVVEENTLRMLVWYDNESGYSSKVIDIIQIASKQ